MEALAWYTGCMLNTIRPVARVMAKASPRMPHLWRMTARNRRPRSMKSSSMGGCWGGYWFISGAGVGWVMVFI